MRSDYPAFQRPTWTIRDWAAIDEISKNIFIIETTPIMPGEIRTYTVYTVPSGKRAFVTGIFESFEVRTETTVYTSGGILLFKGYKEEFMHWVAEYAPTLIFPAGTTFYLDCKNVDIIPGRFSVVWQGFELPASKPAEPKSDDPIELFKTGTFHYCNIFMLPNGEEVIIFWKLRDKFRNYLRVKNIYEPDEEVISQFKLKPEECQEIIKISSQKPEKFTETLEKYEKKYRRKSSNFSK
jgi:hypothetical protein